MAWLSKEKLCFNNINSYHEHDVHISHIWIKRLPQNWQWSLQYLQVQLPWIRLVWSDIWNISLIIASLITFVFSGPQPAPSHWRNFSGEIYFPNPVLHTKLVPFLPGVERAGHLIGKVGNQGSDPQRLTEQANCKYGNESNDLSKLDQQSRQTANMATEAHRQAHGKASPLKATRGSWTLKKTTGSIDSSL